MSLCRPTTTQRASAGWSPIAQRRCGAEASNETAMPGPEVVLVEADAHSEPAARDVAVLLSAVADERVLVARRCSGRVDDREELDERITRRREALPAHAGLEVDHARAFPGPSRVARPCEAVDRRQAARRPGHRRRDRPCKPEHGDERPEGAHGRVDLVALDLRDEAGETPTRRAISRTVMPLLLRSARSRSPMPEGSTRSESPDRAKLPRRRSLVGGRDGRLRR